MNAMILQTLQDFAKDSQPAMSRLCNMLSALYWMEEGVSWSGLYFSNPDGSFYLGPFQGKPACMIIEAHNGIIGSCADQQQTLIVDDVHAFAGHIACDPASKSEVVIPLLDQEKLIAVLDLDSDQPAYFHDWSPEQTENLQQLFENVLLQTFWQIKEIQA